MALSDSTMPEWFPACLQLFDSALPTGAYAHSQGLEGLVQAGELGSVAEVMDFLSNEVGDSLMFSDLPVFREAYFAASERAYTRITEIDELAVALRPTWELRKSAAQVGRQTWKLYGGIWLPDSAEYKAHSRASEFLCNYQAVVVYGILSGILSIPPEHAMGAYVQQQLTNFAQACIKLLGFGPSAVQKMIHELNGLVPDWIRASQAVELDQAGSMAPRWDIASARHQFAERRLFIS